MGVSSSKNITKLVTDVINKSSNEIIQQQNTETDQSIVVKVSNTGGNVYIGDSVFTQEASINMQSLAAALSSTEMQTKLNQEIAQQAKALVSGINLLQLSSTSNTIDQLIKTCIDIKNTTIQNCMSKITQNINITVDKTAGDVKIKNIVSSQLATSISSCVQNAVSSNKGFVDIATKIEQSATSESKGFSLEFLALIAGALFLTVGGGAYAGLKFVFPGLLLASVITGIFWFNSENREISSYGYVPKIISEESSSCTIKPSEANKDIGSATLASEKCQNNSKCTGYEYFNNKASFYTETINQACIEYYKEKEKDKSYSFRDNVFITVDHIPAETDIGDVAFYATTESLSLYYKSEGVWLKRTESFPANTTWGSTQPNFTTTGDVYLDYSAKTYIKIFKKINGVWVEDEGKIQLEQAMVEGTLGRSKFVGFAVVYKTKWLLFLAIGLFVVGLIGTVLVNVKGGKGKQVTK